VSSQILGNKEITTMSNFQAFKSKYDWIQVTSNINRKSKVCNNNLIQLIPHTANKFETLTNLKEDSETSCAACKKEESTNLRGHQIKAKKTQIVKSLRKGKHKVLIIGDSHTRNCATLVQDKLGTGYEVSSFVEPGAQMNVITQTAREEIKSLKCNDVVVVWGGAYDISRNNSKEALKFVTDFVNEHKKVNTVLINAPQT